MSMGPNDHHHQHHHASNGHPDSHTTYPHPGPSHRAAPHAAAHALDPMDTTDGSNHHHGHNHHNHHHLVGSAGGAAAAAARGARSSSASHDDATPPGSAAQKMAQSSAAQGLGQAALLNLPRLYIVDYDMTSGWAQDVFSLPHNAVRRELIDLYTILGAVYKRNARTSREEDERFSQWWSVFSAFVEEYFDIEARILLPLIGPAEEDPVHKQDIAVLMYQMEDARIKLVKKLREVNEVVEKLFVLPMKDVFPMLCRALDHFVPMLLDYFIEEEDVLPNYILGFHSLVMKDVVIQKMADFVLVGREPQLFIVILSAWMDDKDQLNNWKKKALRGVNRYVNFQRWEAKFVKTHKRIVEDFHNTVLRNSRLRNSSLRSGGLRSNTMRSSVLGRNSSRGMSSSRGLGGSRGLNGLRRKHWM